MKPCLILASAFSSQSVPHPVPSPYQIPPFWGSALMIHPTLVLPSPVPYFTVPGPGWNQTLLHPWQLPVCCSSRELIWPVLTHVTHPWFPVLHSTQPALYFSYTHHLPGLLHATCLHTPCSAPPARQPGCFHKLALVGVANRRLLSTHQVAYRILRYRPG